MNQSERYIKGKCLVCGKEINLLQVYDRCRSEYITIASPFCMECEKKKKEHRKEVYTH